MKNRRIRLMAMAVAVFLLLAIPVVVVAEGDSETGALKDRLLSDFFDYLYAQERICGDVLWAEACLEQYDQTRSWDRLLIARAAANAAWSDISSQELPEPCMTADDYYELLLADVDAGFMELSGEDFLSSRTLMENIVLSMMYHLEINVFESNGWENSVQHAKLMRECAEDYLRYCAYTTDWLLKEMDDPARAEYFGAFLTENCPAIASMRPEDLADQEALEAATDQLLTRIEELNGAMAELTGQVNADLYLYADAVESGNATDGLGEIIAIDGLPLLLPYPAWDEDLSTRHVTYYWNDEDSSVRVASAGDSLDSAPDGCVMEIPGVSREDLENYRDYLDSIGVASLMSKEEDGGLTVYYSFAGSQFVFQWARENLTLHMLETPVCFAPVWYISGR